MVEVAEDSDFFCLGVVHLLCGSDPCLVGQTDVGQSSCTVWYIPEAKEGCPETRQSPDRTYHRLLSVVGWWEQSKKMTPFV